MLIDEVVEIKDYPCIISIIGGGGKTSTMFALAEELRQKGKKVLVTTTTHISLEQGKGLEKLIVEPEYNSAVVMLKESFKLHNIIGLTTTAIKGKKLKGVPSFWIEDLKSENIVDVIIVEADGARGRSFKAPATHEPVIPKKNDIVIAVMGIDALYKPITEQYVHRPERILAILGIDENEDRLRLTRENIPKVIFHREGLLKNISKDVDVYFLINKVSKDQEDEAVKLANSIIEASHIKNLKVLIGQTQNISNPISHSIKKREKLAAVILASGMSKRFGENKLLMPLGNQSIVEHAIDNVKGSNISRVFLVYGHHKEDFEKIAHQKQIELIYNGEYQIGQSRAVKKAVETIENDVEGIMFLLGDQPFVNTNTINLLMEKFEMNPENIILPTYDGKRGNPVIFSKKFFKEIKKLQGDKGARDIIEKNLRNVINIPISDTIGNFDIDTKEDYEKAVRKEKNNEDL